MGTIVLMGGSEFRPNCVAMDRSILGRMAGQPPRVVIVPTANREAPSAAAKNGVAYFEALGVEATAAMVIARADAGDPQLASLFRPTDLVYLTGGDPWHLLQTLRGSRVWAAIVQAWSAGAIIAGSSAGAMVLGERMWWNGGWTDALGLAPGVAVLPHYRLTGSPKPEPGFGKLGGLIVLGIPEAAACISEYGHAWLVTGQGKVAVFGDNRAELFGGGEGFALAS
jgi:cyanophycinase